MICGGEPSGPDGLSGVDGLLMRSSISARLGLLTSELGRRRYIIYLVNIHTIILQRCVLWFQYLLFQFITWSMGYGTSRSG